MCLEGRSVSRKSRRPERGLYRRALAPGALTSMPGQGACG
jgi:hypothetical protein